MGRKIVLFLSAALCAAVFLTVRETQRTSRAEAQASLQQSEFDRISSGIVSSSRADGAASSAAPAAGTAGAAPRDAEIWLSPYQDAFAQHRDMAAWLKIDGTAVDCPVMLTPDDPDFYLTHGLDGSESRSGVPYLQASCQLDSSDNLVVFGHSMRNGTMFAGLLKYTDESYWEQHPDVRLGTRTEDRRYRIFAVFRESVASGAADVFDYWNFTKAKSPEEFRAFADQMAKRSLYQTGFVPAPGDQLLTLSTCEYTLDDGRLAVAAMRVS